MSHRAPLLAAPRRHGRVLRAALGVVVAGVAGAAPLACTSPSPAAFVLVSARAGDPALTAARDAARQIDPRAVASSSACALGGVTLVRVHDHDAAARVGQALATPSAPAAGAAGLPRVEVLDDVIARFAIRGSDTHVARDAVDQALLPALRAVPGVHVDVRGGRRQRVVELSAAALVANDLPLGDVVSAVRAASSLDRALVRSSPPLRLTDIATVGLATAREPARRDGAVDVVVRGAPSTRDAVRAVVAGARLPGGLEVALLDDDSDEAVEVRARADRDVDGLRRALLSIPGVRLATRGAHPEHVIDPARVRALSLDLAAVTRLAHVVDGGGVENSTAGPLQVSVDGAPDAVDSVIVGRLPTGEPVRLFDVARRLDDAAPRDTLDGSAAVRIVVRFDVGARRSALADLREVAARWGAAQAHDDDTGAVVVVERDVEAAFFASVCP